MKPPPRIIDGDDLGSRLLRSARQDAPGRRSRRRVMGAVAVALGGMSMRAAVAQGGTALARQLVVKLLVGGAAVAIAAGGLGSGSTPRTVGHEVTSAHVSGPPRSAPPRAAVAVPVAVSPAAVPGEAVGVEVPAVAALVAPVQASAGSGLRAVAAPARPPLRPVSPEGVGAAIGAGTLADEVSLLSDAKRALEAGEPASALAAVGRYRARFPGGALAPEAAAIEIQATARAGRSERAAALFHRFADAHPDSPLLDGLRAETGDSSR